MTERDRVSRSLVLMERGGDTIAIGDEGLVVSRDGVDRRTIRYTNIAVVGLTRLASAPASNRPIPDVFRPSVFWSPPDDKPWFGAFCCTIIPRDGVPLNAMSIARDAQDNVVDRGDIYRDFVATLHRKLAGTGANVEYLAGLPTPRLLTHALAATAMALCVALVVSPFVAPALSRMGSLASLLVMTAVLGGLCGAYIRRNRFLPYDPAMPPVRWLPPPG